MKKVLALFALVCLMVFILSFSALGAGQVYFDYIADGEYVDDELSGYAIGVEFKSDSFKFGFDYLTGDAEDRDEYEINEMDYTQIYLKGGYGITKNIFLTLSWLDITVEPFNEEISIDGFVLGADLSYNFTNRFTFEGTYGISVTGYLTQTGFASEDIDFTVLKLKLINYLFDNIGIYLGYNNISLEDAGGDSADINNMTLGATYKF